ncbi:hypothetical protein CPB86DRAFT_782394 [Serendipita vermifera]|nr:hypothetical protein CPB86DRAFT_782394 [Serendipita vermifera]
MRFTSSVIVLALFAVTSWASPVALPGSTTVSGPATTTTAGSPPDGSGDGCPLNWAICIGRDYGIFLIRFSI